MCLFRQWPQYFSEINHINQQDYVNLLSLHGDAIQPLAKEVAVTYCTTKGQNSDKGLQLPLT